MGILDRRNAKYELLKDDYRKVIVNNGWRDEEVKVYRIRAIKNFKEVGEGTLGGYIQSGDNLSNEGDAWVFPGGIVCGGAVLFGDSSCENSTIKNGIIYGNVRIVNSTIVACAEIKGDGIIENTTVIGNGKIDGKYEIKDCCISDGVEIFNAKINNSNISNATLIGGKNLMEIKDSTISGSTLNDCLKIQNSVIAGGIKVTRSNVSGSTLFGKGEYIDCIIKNATNRGKVCAKISEFENCQINSCQREYFGEDILKKVPMSKHR